MTWQPQTGLAIRITQKGQVRITQNGAVRCVRTSAQPWPPDSQDDTSWIVQGQQVPPWQEQ